jgi:Kef-type K+ transport system membrane component KefB
LIEYVLYLVLVVLVSFYFGKFFKHLGLPLISGFLFAGIIFGPFFVNYITRGMVKDIHFIDDIALGFIALSAGAELHFSELRARLKSIFSIMISLVICTMSIGTLGFYLLSDWIPFTEGLSSIKVFSISLLVGVILVARSPSAAIAIINELKAKGPFTQTVLGVTVLMDVVVITLFAINLSIADALIGDKSLNLSFIGTLAIEILSSVLLGALLALLINVLLSTRLNDYVKGITTLTLGYLVFVLADVLPHWSESQFQTHFTIEPLLLCMVAGVLLTNFGDPDRQFHTILSRINLYVYLAFFTLIGASLEFDVLLHLWPIALIIFCIRLVGIFLGSYLGGRLAKDPKRENKLRWMGFVTQAGVGLGLAKEVASHFPNWGPSFATLIISVIVINEMIGPIFFKWVIHLVDEVGIQDTKA